jgi:hypothetical protein
MRIGVVVLVFLATRSAFATGLCENVGSRYDAPELFDRRRYQPIAAPKACKLTAAWTDVESGGGWRGATVQLDVMRAGKRVLRTKLGDGSVARRGDQLVRAHALVAQKALAVFAIVPACAGPPPGYFGPDDGGTCYHSIHRMCCSSTRRRASRPRIPAVTPRIATGSQNMA